MVRDIQPVHRSDPYPAWQQLLVNTLDNPELHPEIRQDITNALLFAGYLLAELDPPQRRTSSRLSSAHNKVRFCFNRVVLCLFFCREVILIMTTSPTHHQTSGAESPVRKISATGASVNKVRFCTTLYIFVPLCVANLYIDIPHRHTTRPQAMQVPPPSAGARTLVPLCKRHS